MKAYYTDQFVLPLPPEHRFPMGKYSRLRERVAQAEIVQLDVPDAATDTQLLRCHVQSYLDKVKHGTLSKQEIRRIGFPWSLGMVERSRRSTGATIAAALAAMKNGTAANLAGGTHHACTDHGEGFCVWNDAAVAARELQARGRIRRAVIIDCDVHQGNGTAQICAGDDTIFTFSIHGQNNFPVRKVPGDLDIGLPDGTSDEYYLDMVEEGTRRALFIARPELAIYIAGADPFIGDRLGKLAITKAGLAARDRLVLDLLTQAGLPVVITMGGGYANDIEDIVDIHFETIRIAAQHR